MKSGIKDSLNKEILFEDMIEKEEMEKEKTVIK
jgi:hypothetical protein